VLGTLRLAALKDVKSMHEAGQFLGQLDEYTQAARDAIATTKAQVRGAKGRAGSISKRDQSAASSQEEEMDDKRYGPSEVEHDRGNVPDQNGERAELQD